MASSTRSRNTRARTMNADASTITLRACVESVSNVGVRRAVKCKYIMCVCSKNCRFLLATWVTYCDISRSYRLVFGTKCTDSVDYENCHTFLSHPDLYVCVSLCGVCLSVRTSHIQYTDAHTVEWCVPVQTGTTHWETGLWCFRFYTGVSMCVKCHRETETKNVRRKNRHLRRNRFLVSWIRIATADVCIV